jgi:phospholipase C
MVFFGLICYMTDTRRDFIKKATLLAGASGLFAVLPDSIQKALAIDAEKGTTYLDAEHVVFLMQENRSFDHCYGTLQGVRGFDDPRAMRLPGMNKVWAQTNKTGETYVPFNLDIKNSKATWMQSLPHSWDNQVDAHNQGKMDNWLESKKSGNKQYAHMPLTMGYYDRNDIPFYYALADAFTVCDQHFCSSLTGTSANRSYFWAGTIREEQDGNLKANVYNGEINYKDLTATTFPERLEQLGISWKVYQNELSIDVGFNGDEDDWLSNFTDNNLEFYKNYNVKLHRAHLNWLPKRRAAMEAEIAELQKQPVTPITTAQLKKKAEELERVKTEIADWTQERFDRLSDFEKNIHLKAFTTNINDPDYHQLSTLAYDDNGTPREVAVPKGDVLHQFRQDVKTGKLPTVSWLAAPSNFSDHPGSPWYGAWYVSEVLDILTQNPEVWKKTIFVLTYDENDGYFDHIAPFVPPNTAKPESGGVSAGMNTETEHVTKEQEMARGGSVAEHRESPIGLGFRVPMVVASPWSRGGWVNSQVFDHTSTLQFLETFLSKKTGKAVKESNISDWRRTVCGDLTSIFRPYNGEKISYPLSLNRDKTVQGIHQAKFKGLPNKFKALTPEDIKTVNSKTGLANFAKQEKGTRQSCALPYDLEVNGSLSPQKSELKLTFKAGKGVGAPFNVYTQGASGEIRTLNFAAKANDAVDYVFGLDNFKDGIYNIMAYGPNGFLRTFSGDKDDPTVMINIIYGAQGDIEIRFKNAGTSRQDIIITDNSYKVNNHKLSLAAGASTTQKLDLQKSHNWYDFTISLKDNDHFSRTYAGRVETGKPGFTDPLIGA